MALPEIGGGRSETVLAGEVLHFRIGCDAVTPWAGSAPLARVKLSALLLEEITGALCDVSRREPRKVPLRLVDQRTGQDAKHATDLGLGLNQQFVGQCFVELQESSSGFWPIWESSPQLSPASRPG